jgi:hypothetical protein
MVHTAQVSKKPAGGALSLVYCMYEDGRFPVQVEYEQVANHWCRSKVYVRCMWVWVHGVEGRYLVGACGYGFMV